ncbi:MAG: hypothetical protein LBB87_02195 [Nitrososphaerota archaeon]|jgi:hypothetical protein|nr:hypothetical protein [Nitrososphaerota archaeon]
MNSKIIYYGVKLFWEKTIAACSSKIYCIGGLQLGTSSSLHGRSPLYSIPCDVVEVYDTVADSWSVTMSLPFNGMCLQAQMVDDKLFVISRFGALFLYDPVKDSWTEKTSLPATEFWADILPQRWWITK